MNSGFPALLMYKIFGIWIGLSVQSANRLKDKTFWVDLLDAENTFECEGLYAKSYTGFHPVP